MQKKEMWFGTEVQKYIKALMCFNGPIETKVSYGNLFNYKSGFKEHQLRYLINVRNGCVTYKISDLDRMQKPWDIDCYCKADSWVVFYWVRPGNKKFYFINPITVQGEIDDGKKSLSEERAAQLSEHIGTLK